jgi:lambda family phage portal protein
MARQMKPAPLDTRPDLITRALAVVAPRAAMNRHKAVMKLRAYAAALPENNVRSKTRTKGGSPRREIAQGAKATRDSARDLVRNQPEAVALLSKLAAHLIADGIYPRAASPDTVVNERAQAAWDAWADDCDVSGVGSVYMAQVAAVRAWLMDGEAFILWRAGERDPYGTIEVLEADWCPLELDSETGTLPSEGLADGHVLVQGIELDASGRRAAIWLHETHPGERRARVRSYRRIPVDLIDHLFWPDRPGAQRGVSFFAPLIKRIDVIVALVQAGLDQARVQSMFGITVEREDTGADDAAATSPLQDAATDDGELVLEQGGQVLELKPGQTAKAFQATGAPANVQTQIQQQMTQAATAFMGLPAHMATGDVSRANYSSLRAAMIDFHLMLGQFQQLCIVPRIVRPAWQRRMKVAGMQATTITPAQLAALETCPAAYNPPPRAEVDPLKAATARTVDLATGRLTFPDMLAEIGKTEAEQVAAIAATLQAFDRIGFVAEWDRRKVSKAGVGQADPFIDTTGTPSTEGALPTDPELQP